MRAFALLFARVALLGGPTVLAFFSGGYFDRARLGAAVGAWVLLALALVVVDRRVRVVPRRGPAAVALGGMALLTAWTALSALWAPGGVEAADALQRAALYLGGLGAAWLLLQGRAIARWVEPALAGGTLVVTGYALCERVLPGVVELTRTVSAGGRLDQPLSYWNASGALAALGAVLCVRLAGDRTRPDALRCAAAAGAAPLMLGVYLTFSRGSITALGVGLAVVLALAPTWPQLRSATIALEAAALCVLTAAALPAVRLVSEAHAERDGAILLVVLLAAMAGAAALQRWSARAEAAETAPSGELPRARTVVRLGAVAAVLLALAPFAAGAIEGGSDGAGAGSATPAFGATNERLGSLSSRRFDYWKAAAKGFADAPLLGEGAGGFRAIWLRERDVDERVLDAHSLPIETAAELGLIGLALLLALAGGVAAAARRVARSDASVAAGPAAALAVWAAHAAIDWDWELPALTLVAVVLAGHVLARADAAG